MDIFTAFFFFLFVSFLSLLLLFFFLLAVRENWIGKLNIWKTLRQILGGNLLWCAEDRLSARAHFEPRKPQRKTSPTRFHDSTMDALFTVPPVLLIQFVRPPVMSI